MTKNPQKWTVPKKAILDEYQAICNTYLSQIYVNDKQGDILSVLRDTLLPKLISGDLRVPDAEKLLEGLNE